MKDYIEKSMTWSGYANLLDRLLAEGKTTGPNQSDAMLDYAKLNIRRMKRVEKTTVLGESILASVRENRLKMIWLIITEGWCGDAAQSIPVIERIAAAAENIETRYVLRDENLGLMDAYLTNGARSIPKLIALDAETLAELGTWGPRPRAAMDYFLEMKSIGLDKSEMMEKLQRWYNEDRNQAIQNEFQQLLEHWNSSSNAANN
ncbi:MAG: thioredoxin family protein [Acidobacteria bacterium]|nr:thioredoxin family protein [Acidobacteriota bacterium]